MKRPPSIRRALLIRCGIGLALSLEAAIAMGATLHARRTDDGGLECVMGLPVAPDCPLA